jgi:ribosome maturation factor RimP
MPAGADIARVEALAGEVAEGLGVRLYEVRLLTQRGQAVLRVTIDCEGGHLPGKGVTIEQCARVSRALSERLDAEEPITHAYDLEVSSPGVERPLRQPKHFAWALGERVLVWPTPGAGLPEELDGILEAVDAEGARVTLRLWPRSKQKKGQKVNLPPREAWARQEVSLSQIQKARTVYDFSALVEEEPEQAPEGEPDGEGEIV